MDGWVGDEEDDVERLPGQFLALDGRLPGAQHFGRSPGQGRAQNGEENQQQQQSGEGLERELAARMNEVGRGFLFHGETSICGRALEALKLGRAEWVSRTDHVSSMVRWPPSGEPEPDQKLSLIHI